MNRIMGNPRIIAYYYQDLKQEIFRSEVPAKSVLAFTILRG